MFAFLAYLLIFQAFAGELAKPSPLDDELKNMSEELDNMGDNQEKVSAPVPVEQQPQEVQEKKTAAGLTVLKVNEVSAPQMNDKDIIRVVPLEAGEQMALWQSKVDPKIIQTAPGDQFVVMPVVKKTTPCPITTTKKPERHMFCQSCGKKNPKEEGKLTSYIDVASATECAQLCARYIKKGNKCTTWEFHGEWRNRQCFLLYIENFPPCTGQLGVASKDSFQSGTCVEETIIPGEKNTPSPGLELSDKLQADGLPSAFPHVEVASSLFQEKSFIVPAAIGSVLFLGAGLFYASRKTHDYEHLPEEI